MRTLLSRGINPSLKDQHDRYWQGSPCNQKKKCEVVGFMKRNISTCRTVLDVCEELETQRTRDITKIILNFAQDDKEVWS